ncbi:MAG: HAMP domain-containing histidine kinase [Lentisphaerales bacterium]|nr:HAMP domain-containing histidine kinase [Lentisphaerales bacterium]
MTVIKSLRFRLTFLFGLSLSLLAALVLIILLNRTENRLLDELDSIMFENAYIIESHIERTLEQISEYKEFNYDKFISYVEKECFALIEHSSLQNEAYILSRDQQTFLFNKTFSDKLFLITPEQLSPLQNRDDLGTLNIPTQPAPLRYLRVGIIDDHELIILTSLEDYRSQITSIRVSFFSAAFALISIGSFIAWFTLGKSMQGVLQVTQAADAFAEGNLKQRVDWQGQGSEITNLVNHFNHMASQTEKLIYEMNEVTNNIAHDLRTPVTRMRGLAENILSKDPQNILAIQVIEECERQTSIIEDILSLAESEAGVLKLKQSQTDLKELLNDLIEVYTPLAESQNCSLVSKFPTSPIELNVDPHRIQRALANLLDNAIKYSPKSEITLELIEDSYSFKIRIKDLGPGIPASDQKKVFERFYRRDKSRGENGSGLGLSLAKSYVENHKGSLELEKSSTGASFLITLPKT